MAILDVPYDVFNVPVQLDGCRIRITVRRSVGRLVLQASLIDERGQDMIIWEAVEMPEEATFTFGPVDGIRHFII